ncbi:MAG: tRNA 2-thiouridine(34) synthase MnmA [Acidiferrobacterales bacterium]|jgi:tRNA-specific 2-thiouridylase|nr:tRNA 2-thiouridine(34) synthase MnmA [Acidiferrobacterales bacterium]
MAGKEHVVVGISGGVDSAVAAMLLLQQGYQVTGVFMKNWEEDDDQEYCAAEEDYRVAREVCTQLEIPLRAINFASEYWDRVFAYFLEEYRAGRTPNPDVMCNKEIKFKAFLDYAITLGAARIATGHYARIDEVNGSHRLLRGKDINKDQSYFLYALGQHELSSSLFPVGELEKPRVRKLAEDAGFVNYDRKDSTGICFIGERRFKDFLAQYLPAQPGEIRDLDGNAMGRHDGLMYTTIGQRHGLGIGGPGDPWYVADKDLRQNILYVVQGQDHPALYRDQLLATDLTWISGQAPANHASCSAKIRYRQQDTPCTLEFTDNGVNVNFVQAQRAITPGQSIVFYDGDVCLGGGIIQSPQNRSTVAGVATVAA